MIRKARTEDVKEIKFLIDFWAEKGQMLSRSLSEIYDCLRDYYIYEEKEKILGVCAMHVCWEDLAEIRSLAVREGSIKKKIGKTLVGTCISEKEVLGIHKIFVLTYQPEFFRKLGFKTVDRMILPHKVWADCIKCTKFPDCDEIALVME